MNILDVATPGIIIEKNMTQIIIVSIIVVSIIIMSCLFVRKELKKHDK